MRDKILYNLAYHVCFVGYYKVKDFVKSRLWKIVKLLATYLSGLDEWYPYDVSMNIIRNSHYPRIHEDCEPNEVLIIY